MKGQIVKKYGDDIVKVAVVGSRNATNLKCEDIATYLPDHCQEIVSGGSGAVDILAKKIAELKCLKFKCFLPQYDIYGKAAPLIRNLKIIEYSDMILAFWDKVSPGTKFVIKEAIKCSVPIKTIYVNSMYSIFNKENIK